MGTLITFTSSDVKMANTSIWGGGFECVPRSSEAGLAFCSVPFQSAFTQSTKQMRLQCWGVQGREARRMSKKEEEEKTFQTKEVLMGN